MEKTTNRGGRTSACVTYLILGARPPRGRQHPPGVRLDVEVVVDERLRAREPAAVDDRRVVERVREDHVALARDPVADPVLLARLLAALEQRCQHRSGPALTDAEKRRSLLAPTVSERVNAAGQPAMRAVGGVSHRGEIRRQTDEMIEGHHDVGSPTELHSYRQLRCEFPVAAVDVGAKRDAGFANPRIFSQAENLEPAAIGEDWTGPTHESMQPTSGDEGL